MTGLDVLKATVQQQKEEIAQYEQFAQQAKRECMLLTTKVVEIVRKNDTLTQALETERSTLKTVADRFCHEQISSEALKKQLIQSKNALAEHKMRCNSLERTVNEQAEALRVSESEAGRDSLLNFTSIGLQTETVGRFSAKDKLGKLLSICLTRMRFGPGTLTLALDEEVAITQRIAKALVHSYTSAGMSSVIAFYRGRAARKLELQRLLRQAHLEEKHFGMTKLNDRVSTVAEGLERLACKTVRLIRKNDDMKKQSAIEKDHMEGMIKALHLREAAQESVLSKQTEEIQALTEELSNHRSESLKRGKTLNYCCLSTLLF